MPAEPVRPRYTRGEIRLRRATPITHRVVLAKRVMRATMPRILGAFLICTEMCGSGRRTGTELTVREHRPIPQDRHRAPAVFFGAGLGALQARSCVRPPAATTPRATATAALASVLVSKSNRQGAKDGRMTDIATKRGRAGLAWTKGAVAQKGHDRHAEPRVSSHPRLPFTHSIYAKA